ncbi:hydroxysteroid dehydrogenase-like protein 1 [Centruroides sculpturatus]|uniref:hydroxysteroid dehydrogenase-like protein 1 n=1 Tax=Centruroides sculpturatus TaxID=218467 RepID=UPI000C6DDA65|nr:hydroxysteroid dehydrogenase-like protein 1 [Centruroides sculpturatus]
MFQCESPHLYFLAFVGFIFTLLILIHSFSVFIRGLKLYVFSKFFPPNVNKYGVWAVITGSTDGIGKSYAKELARRGMNIVLVSRNLEKLRITADEMEKEFKVCVQVIQADFTEGWTLYERIKSELMSKNIGILINNVGLMAPQPCQFLSLSQRNILDIIHVNITSVLLMTSAILPKMLERKRGAIVNMSSLIALYNIPLFSCYGACKSAGNSIGLALTYEDLTGINFQTLILSCVTTNLLDYSNKIWKWLSFFAPNADSYVKSAINTLGRSNHTTGYFGHSLQISFKIFPETVQKYSLYWICSYLFKRKENRTCQ